MKRWILRNGMQAVLGLSAFLARGTVRAKRIAPAADLPALGAAWQRGFPSPKQVPIVAIDDRTVIAEIHTPCPLRGSGDTRACWRMMEYDREVARAAGGDFVVLRSQAEPGVAVCRVALRQAGGDLSDLVPAHVRAPNPT